MPTDFFFTYHPFKPELVKQARDGTSPPIDHGARQECDRIMQRIYEENPSFWPHGVGTDMLDGGAYLIRNSHTKKAMGFAGWQERMEGTKRIGYYAIGVLPEFRGQGLAKQAVARLIKEKAASVDEVRAFIVPENTPSIALAKSLNVPVQHKSASARFVGPALGALAGAAGTDYIVHEGDYSHFSPQRIGMGVMNTVLGGGAGHKIQKGDWNTGAGLLGLLPVKDLAISSLGPVAKAGPLMDAAKAKLEAPEIKPAMSGKDLATAGGLALGGGALGYAIYRGLKKLRQPRDTGKVRIKLPRPDGTFTEVEMPMEQLVDLPDSVTESLGRDVKRQLRTESRLRTFRRGRDNKLYPLIHDDEDLVTKAAAAGMGGPALGPRMLPPISFQNNAQAIRQKHEQAQTALDQQAQVQQQQQAELAAKAPAAPVADARPPISSGLQYATNRTLKTIGSLKRANDDPFAPAKPKAAPTSPSIGAPTATSPTPTAPSAPAAAPIPAPAPLAPAAAPTASAQPDPYAEHRQRMLAQGMTVADSTNGITGTDRHGNKYNVDSAGRKSYYRAAPAPAAPSDGSNDPWYHKYNPVSRATYALMGGEQADYGSLQDWMHGRPGSTVLGDYEGKNPFKHIGRIAENTVRGYARGNDAVATGLDAVRAGDYDEALHQAGRFGTEYGANSLQLGGTLMGASSLGAGGMSGNLLKGTGRLMGRKAVPSISSRFGMLSSPASNAFGRGAQAVGRSVVNHGAPLAAEGAAFGAGASLDQINEEHIDPYRISGSEDPRLAAALGEKELSNRATAPNFNSQFDLSMANQGMAPWAFNLPQVSPYAQDRMSLVNRMSQNPLGALATGWLMPKIYGQVAHRDMLAPTF